MDEQTRMLAVFAQELGEAGQRLPPLQVGYGSNQMRPSEYDELQFIFSQLHPKLPALQCNAVPDR
ncbi:hypothetical protein HS961_09095 [Comamonas piscis]|uniref:Uncharacterized protein n=1 Tax=Comamonas piscis TaxID=1562974 RepID=A0A7G5EG57_9BURK|nr:hypothetical protein [Comamonas piscis]QMV72982.1 hypothetical protein HS961_09095 [Comamonas piscis]WSO35765.1 hypothetical protein VUJ63_09120 [Comamonas piscis]